MFVFVIISWEKNKWTFTLTQTTFTASRSTSPVCNYILASSEKAVGCAYRSSIVCQGLHWQFIRNHIYIFASANLKVGGR